MQEFWATATVHYHSIRFKMNNKKHIMNLEYFREMLQICPGILNQQFDELPFKKAILTFLRELGHSDEIKMITDVNINKLHQPWRSFVAVINKCLSGKSTEHKDDKKSNEMYYPRFTKAIVNFFMTKDQSIPRRNKVNWHFARDDHIFTTIKLVFRHQNTQQYGAILPIELTNEAIRNFESYKEYYAIALGAEPPNTKVSVRKKQSSSNTTMPPPTAKGKRLKTSAKVDKPAKEKQPAKTYKAKGLTMLSEVALTEAEQMKLATKRSLKQTHISYASGSGADEGTGIIPGVPDVPTYESDDEEISWKSSEDNDDDEVNMSEHDEDVDDQTEQMKLAIKPSLAQTHISHTGGSGADEGTGILLGVYDVPTCESDDEEISWKSSEDNDDDEVNMSEHDEDVDDQSDDNDQNDDDDQNDNDDQNDDDEQTDLDNDGDDFIQPKFSTDYDEDKEDESFDPIVQTHSHDEKTDDEDNDEDSRDIQMADVQITQVIEDTHVTLTSVNLEGQQQSSSVSSRFVLNMLNPSLDTGIDSIFNLNIESTPRVDVPVTTTAELPLLSATTLPPPPTPIILTLQQTPVPSPANVPCSSLQDLPNFGSLFGFDHRLKALEINFSEFMQTSQFAEAISLILGIVDKYLNHRINKTVKVVVQLQSDRLRDEAQAENEDFLNKLDENIQKIIKEQVREQVKAQVSKILPKIEKTVNEQLKAEVLTRSSNSSKTFNVVAANLSKLELKKILIEKIESNKSIHISDEQKNLYKALVNAYECDKLILDTYRDMVTLKIRRDDEDKDKEPSAGSNQGSKRRRAGKKPESTSAPKEKTSETTGKSTEGSKSHHKSASESAPAEEPMHTTKDLEEPAHQEFDTGATDDQPVEDASQHPDWFQEQAKPPTPDRAWNKTLPATHGPIQPWINNLARKDDSRTSFNELMDTPFEFSAFVMNRLKVDTLTPELLAGPTYELMKGSCKSLVELEFFLEEVYKATTDQLDWYNPKGQKYLHDLRKPLPLIPTSRGRRVISFDHFINNDLEYLRGGVSSQIYTTSVTKTKAANYGHIKWIEDLAPRTMWSQVPESAQDVYSKRRIIAVTGLQIIEWHNYKHLDWITFSDDTLNDVRTALNDRLKGIRMQYLSQTIWRQSDKDRATAMIQAIDKQLKTRRIMRSLEKFVGGRLYEGDFRLLQRTI
nr:hypothetical protein [Tanacetum cinerariifolium]